MGPILSSLLTVLVTCLIVIAFMYVMIYTLVLYVGIKGVLERRRKKKVKKKVIDICYDYPPDDGTCDTCWLGNDRGEAILCEGCEYFSEGVVS